MHTKGYSISCHLKGLVAHVKTTAVLSHVSILDIRKTNTRTVETPGQAAATCMTKTKPKHLGAFCTPMINLRTTGHSKGSQAELTAFMSGC